MAHQPSIYIGQLRVDEPITTLTDLIITAVCWYAFAKLKNRNESGEINHLLQCYFLSMGLATALGGLVGHAFLYMFNDHGLTVSPWKLPGWVVSMLSITLIERASIKYAKPLITPWYEKIFSWINVIELIVFVIITFVTLNFFFVEIHSAYGLLFVVAGFHGYVYWKVQSKASANMLIAVLWSSLAALVFMNKLGISKWLNHFDISHLLMAVSAYYFYLGARNMSNPIKQAA